MATARLATARLAYIESFNLNLIRRESMGPAPYNLLWGGPRQASGTRTRGRIRVPEPFRTNPLEQGLGDRFFLSWNISDMSAECQYCVAICRAATSLPSLSILSLWS